MAILSELLSETPKLMLPTVKPCTLVRSNDRSRKSSIFKSRIN